jgi:hypothetical protein
MTWQKILPVLTSIGIILLVAVARERSRALAAVLATMPINVPLALWVVSSGSNNDTQVMADFVRSLLISVAPAWVWLLIVFWAIRARWNLWLAIGAGYGVWAILVAIMFWFGILVWPK